MSYIDKIMIYLIRLIIMMALAERKANPTKPETICKQLFKPSDINTVFFCKIIQILEFTLLLIS